MSRAAKIFASRALRSAASLAGARRRSCPRVARGQLIALLVAGHRAPASPRI